MRSKSLGLGVLLLLSVLLVASGCTGQDESENPNRGAFSYRGGLPDGIRLPNGTRMAGPPVPNILYGPLGAAGEGSRSWWASIKSARTPEATYQAFADQAGALGLPAMPPARISCYGSPSEHTCTGLTNAPDNSRWYLLNAQPCTSGGTAIGVGYSTRKDPPAVTRLPPIPRARFQERDNHWPVLRGTQALAPGMKACLGGRLLAVTGSPKAVWKRYLAQLSYLGDVAQSEATFDGHRVKQAGVNPLGNFEKVTLIQGSDLVHPVLVVEKTEGT